jgi:hypothetical protein
MALGLMPWVMMGLLLAKRAMPAMTYGDASLAFGRELEFLGLRVV